MYFLFYFIFFVCEDIWKKWGIFATIIIIRIVIIIASIVINVTVSFQREGVFNLEWQYMCITSQRRESLFGDGNICAVKYFFQEFSLNKIIFFVV